MSNYYKSINNVMVQLSDFIQNTNVDITNVDITSNYVGIGITINTTSIFKSGITGINEKPSPTQYLYNGTDIAHFCIAKYMEGTSTPSTLSIPSWCTKIRAVLIGGGGGGEDSKINKEAINKITIQQETNHQNNISDQQYDADEQTNYDSQVNNRDPEDQENNSNHDESHHASVTISHYHNIYNEINNSSPSVNTGGKGGGGGGFIYLSDLDVNNTTINISVGTGGSANLNGGNTILTKKYNNNNIEYAIAYGGTSGSNDTPSGGDTSNNLTINGTLEEQGAQGGVVNNTISTAGSGGKSGARDFLEDTYTYGNGGDGGSGADTKNAGKIGKDGYYRIYYLTS